MTPPSRSREPGSATRVAPDVSPPDPISETHSDIPDDPRLFDAMQKYLDPAKMTEPGLGGGPAGG